MKHEFFVGFLFGLTSITETNQQKGKPEKALNTKPKLQQKVEACHNISGGMYITLNIIDIASREMIKKE